MAELTHKALIDTILSTNDILQREEDLSPRNPVINEALGYYVDSVLKADENGLDIDAVLNSPKVQEVRPQMLQRLWLAERQMEVFFSDYFVSGHLITQQTPDLHQFWYLHNYAELIEEEVRALTELEPEKKFKNIAFVGSGPLPLSAKFLIERTGAHVTCIDFDQECYEKGAHFLNAIGLSGQTTSINADGCDYEYSGHDAVFIATMTGNKQDIIERIKQTSPDATIGIRSVDKLKTLLYEPIDSKDIKNCAYAEVAFAPARSTTINCTHFFQRAAENLGANPHSPLPDF